MQRAWYSADAATFVAADPRAIIGDLSIASSFRDEPSQIDAWTIEIDHLKSVVAALPSAYVFLEFGIPRMGRRADAVLVIGGLIFVIEFKVGEENFPNHALQQVHGYALDLKNFHQTSHDKAIVPILVSTEAQPQQLDLGFWAPDKVHRPTRCSPGDLLPTLRQMLASGSGADLDALEWANGAYLPTPTIIEAAEALFRGHKVAEISHSGADKYNLTLTANAIESVVNAMQAKNGKAICFVTGVPGAGKTLAGLSIACSRMQAGVSEDATFLSGNGPLVKVLQAALDRDQKARSPKRKGTKKDEERSKDSAVRKFVMNVHHFRDEYARREDAPSEHLVVFDEAQRAWDAKHTSEFMRKKRKVPGFNQSEPAFLLSVMDRRSDWCVVVCLIGEGQEINVGEAGISEWVRALQADFGHWEVFAPPHLLEADSMLDAGLRWHLENRIQAPNDGLHLRTCLRSFRAATLSDFVGNILSGDHSMARKSKPRQDEYPIFRTRDLPRAREWLRGKRRGTERSGLLASSNALRLKPEGIFVKSDMDVCKWFLEGNGDMRASTALEDVAVEFSVQGLELDWTCVGWDLDFRRNGERWESLRFHGNNWQRIHQKGAGLGRADYVRNAYRVLLTRARQGMIIFVPRGDIADVTRPPAEYDAIYNWLETCAIPELPKPL